jgi:uncharacterized phage infection (PIP) family protein YhgE
MSMHITWDITVNVPQLDTINHTLLTLGAQLMADLQGIKDAIVELTSQQAAGQQALTDQLTVIANEIDQLDAEAIDQAELDALAQQIRDAAAVSQAGVDQVRANSAQIAGMVPDEPPPTP